MSLFGRGLASQRKFQLHTTPVELNVSVSWLLEPRSWSTGEFPWTVTPSSASQRQGQSIEACKRWGANRETVQLSKHRNKIREFKFSTTRIFYKVLPLQVISKKHLFPPLWDKISESSPIWPWTPNPSFSAFQVLGLELFTTKIRVSVSNLFPSWSTSSQRVAWLRCAPWVRCFIISRCWSSHSNMAILPGNAPFQTPDLQLLPCKIKQP